MIKGFAWCLAAGLGVVCGSAALSQDAGKGMYRNPVLFADYSDPDALRVGSDYYLVASTFAFSPGLVILHSKDMAHWEIAGHVLSHLGFGPAYDMKGDAKADPKNDGMRYGRGVWAPAVRFHAGLFYVYFPTPEEGIFVSTAPSMAGPWSEPETVMAGPGFEDPCPLWDDDGQAYLVHSRLGAGPLILHRMSPDGKHVLDEGKVIVQDKANLPTLEGPKFYKRNGWYYIFAPFGGVGKGAQVVLRSRSVDGPYDRRVVLAQGKTAINGPHQGAYVETPEGAGWFLHFQMRGAHGRIVHLEPVRWVDDWPLMGDAALNGAPAGTVGEPVTEAPLPVRVPGADRMKIRTSDEFAAGKLDPMWEWNHNPDDTHWSLAARPGWLRLMPTAAADLMHARNTLTETMQDESLEFTTRLDVSHLAEGDRAGLSFLDRGMSSAGVARRGGKNSIVFVQGGMETPGPVVAGTMVQLRVRLAVDLAQYLYSVDDGRTFQEIGPPVKLVFSWWKGARPALFAFNGAGEPGGYADFDWVHYRALQTPVSTGAMR